MNMLKRHSRHVLIHKPVLTNNLMQICNLVCKYNRGKLLNVWDGWCLTDVWSEKQMLCRFIFCCYVQPVQVYRKLSSLTPLTFIALITFETILKHILWGPEERKPLKTGESIRWKVYWWHHLNWNVIFSDSYNKVWITIYFSLP